MNMPVSQNGWPVGPAASIGVQTFTAGGVVFPAGVKAGNVAAVLGYVAAQFDKRVEPLVNPGCWGYDYKPVEGTNILSNHASGTAIDCNAPQHPRGIAAYKNYTSTQIIQIHRILAEVDGVVHWGGDWASPLIPDPMHFEIHGTAAQVAAVAKKLEHPHVANHVTAARGHLTDAGASLKAAHRSVALGANQLAKTPSRRKVARAGVPLARAANKTIAGVEKSLTALLAHLPKT